LGLAADDRRPAVTLSDTRPAKRLASGFSCGKRGPGAGRNHSGLELGHRNHLLQEESPGSAFNLREVSETHVNARLK
jgi:hypothetical protein